MATKVSKDFMFQAGVYFNKSMLMNIYTFNMTFYVETNCPIEQNVAMDRIKHLLFDCLEHSIFVYEKETDVIEKYLSAGLKVCTLPNIPYDQIVMTALILKFNSITETRFNITDMLMSSKMSDGVKFFGDAKNIDDAFDKSGWWYEPTTNLSDYKRKTTKNSKVVKLIINNHEWDKPLLWEEKKPNEIPFSKETFYPNI